MRGSAASPRSYVSPLSPCWTRFAFALVDSPNCERAPCLRDLRSAFQSLVAFAVVATALLNPDKAAVTSSRLIRLILIKTGVHPRLARRFLGVGGRHRRWKDRIALRLRR